MVVVSNPLFISNQQIAALYFNRPSIFYKTLCNIADEPSHEHSTLIRLNTIATMVYKKCFTFFLKKKATPIEALGLPIDDISWGWHSGSSFKRFQAEGERARHFCRLNVQDVNPGASDTLHAMFEDALLVHCNRHTELPQKPPTTTHDIQTIFANWIDDPNSPLHSYYSTHLLFLDITAALELLPTLLISKHFASPKNAPQRAFDYPPQNLDTIAEQAIGNWLKNSDHTLKRDGSFFNLYASPILSNCPLFESSVSIDRQVQEERGIRKLQQKIRDEAKRLTAEYMGPLLQFCIQLNDYTTSAISEPLLHRLQEASQTLLPYLEQQLELFFMRSRVEDLRNDREGLGHFFYKEDYIFYDRPDIFTDLKHALLRHAAELDTYNGPTLQFNILAPHRLFLLRHLNNYDAFYDQCQRYFPNTYNHDTCAYLFLLLKSGYRTALAEPNILSHPKWYAFDKKKEEHHLKKFIYPLRPTPGVLSMLYEAGQKVVHAVQKVLGVPKKPKVRLILASTSHIHKESLSQMGLLTPFTCYTTNSALAYMPVEYPFLYYQHLLQCAHQVTTCRATEDDRYLFHLRHCRNNKQCPTHNIHKRVSLPQDTPYTQKQLKTTLESIQWLHLDAQHVQETFDVLNNIVHLNAQAYEREKNARSLPISP